MFNIFYALKFRSELILMQLLVKNKGKANDIKIIAYSYACNSAWVSGNGVVYGSVESINETYEKRWLESWQ